MKKLQQDIDFVFGRNTTVNTIYSTSDGVVFLRKEHANAHALTLENKAIREHNRALTVQEETTQLIDFTVNEVKELVMLLDDVDQLEEQLNLEVAKGAKARKGAIEAIEHRIKELTLPVGTSLTDEEE